MKKNAIIGGFLTVLGITILTTIVMVMYHINKTVIWAADSLGASGEAGLGLQMFVGLILVILLLSFIMFGILFITFGVGYLNGITPLKLMWKIHAKIFGDFFDDDDMNFFDR